MQIALDAARLGSYDLELATGLMQCSDQCVANFGLPAGAPFHFPDLIKAILPQYRKYVEEQVNHSIATHTTYSAEYQARWPDGTIHWINASGSPQYNIDGQPIAMIGITQDITAQKEIEAKKNAFIGIVSHELKTPLTSIKGYIQLLTVA